MTTPTEVEQITPPTWSELGAMESSFNVATSYLDLLSTIVGPPLYVDDPDPGLDRFSIESRSAMMFMISEAAKALHELNTLIYYSYDTLRQKKPEKEVKENFTGEVPVFLQEYKKIKSNHKDRIIFFRMGDFYEMFWEDAENTSEILNLTLTFRNRKNSHGSIPMCGVPVLAANTYIAQLVKAGRNVAVCEQVRTDDGLLRYEVVRVITPGEEVS